MFRIYEKEYNKASSNGGKKLRNEYDFNTLKHDLIKQQQQQQQHQPQQQEQQHLLLKEKLKEIHDLNNIINYGNLEITAGGKKPDFSSMTIKLE